MAAAVMAMAVDTLRGKPFKVLRPREAFTYWKLMVAQQHRERLSLQVAELAQNQIPETNLWLMKKERLVAMAVDKLGWTFETASQETAGQLRLFLKENRDETRRQEMIDGDPQAKVPVGLTKLNKVQLMRECEARGMDSGMSSKGTDSKTREMLIRDIKTDAATRLARLNVAPPPPVAEVQRPRSKSRGREPEAVTDSSATPKAKARAARPTTFDLATPRVTSPPRNSLPASSGGQAPDDEWTCVAGLAPAPVKPMAYQPWTGKIPHLGKPTLPTQAGIQALAEEVVELLKPPETLTPDEVKDIMARRLAHGVDTVELQNATAQEVDRRLRELRVNGTRK